MDFDVFFHFQFVSLPSGVSAARPPGLLLPDHPEVPLL